MRLSDFQALTFDCYGTLIDWEAGIVASISPMLARSRKDLRPEAVLEEFARAESWWEAREPAMPYPAILAHVCSEVCGELGVDATDGECERFGASVGSWPPFPDTVDALRYLQDHFRLAVLSNVDRESFASSNRRLEVECDVVCTAEEIGAYKPDPRNFAFLIARVRDDLGIEPGRILHTAQSRFHDHAPATDAGLATCWIDRRGQREGSGATPPLPGEIDVDFRFTGLAEMADAHRQEQR